MNGLPESSLMWPWSRGSLRHRLCFCDGGHRLHSISGMVPLCPRRCLYGHCRCFRRCFDSHSSWHWFRRCFGPALCWGVVRVTRRRRGFAFGPRNAHRQRLCGPWKLWWRLLRWCCRSGKCWGDRDRLCRGSWREHRAHVISLQTVKCIIVVPRGQRVSSRPI